MRIDIITLFPEMCEAVLSESIIGRARESGAVEINCHQLREFAFDKHRRVDDAPYGGGKGMLMMAEPIALCFEDICKQTGNRPHFVFMSPQGKTLTQNRLKELSELDNICVLCGHYEGVDQRLIDEFVDEQISIGDYVLTGGVMIYARNKKTAATLCKAIQDGKMIKEYLAKVHGTPPESGVLEDLLFKDSRKNKVFVVKRQRAGVKKAKLEYKRLTEGEESHVHVRHYTGRSHQIRVQFSSRGFPLVGDHKYGSRSELKAPQLFSHRITFPYMGKEISFEATPEWAEV